MAGLTNPSSTTLSGFNLATLSSAGYVIEQKRGVTFTIQPSTILLSVTPSSYMTNQANVAYNFSMPNGAALSPGYSIKLTFPADYRFINYSSLACTVGGLTVSCGRDNSTFATYTQTVIISVSSTISSTA